jgi:formate-dependent nitrite reductase cytochrome c552 subunit
MSKKISVLMTGVALAGMLAFTSAQAASVTDATSPHNMTATGTVSTTNTGVGSTNPQGRVCVYCHVPHNFATDAIAPMWNRAAATGGPFTPYSSPTLDAGTAGTAPAPDGVSLACLSCHDGVTAFNSLLQHPVSVNITADSAMNAPSVVIAAGVPLFGGATPPEVVQCASCHDPHDWGDTAAEQPFMRIANSSSNLCTTCHQK